MGLKRLPLASAFVLSVPAITHANGVPMNGHIAPPAGYHGGPGSVHPGWQRRVQHFNPSWRAGHWWHGVRSNRLGWWWIVGPAWYWYPAAVYPYPDFYTPPGLEPGYRYWCDFYTNYYPNVSACPTGWEAVEPY
jgi:hypothetical protein